MVYTHLFLTSVFLISGNLTYDIIAKHIKCVLDLFELQAKVTHIVTDNGSNFVKAFKVHQRSDDVNAEDEVEDEEENYDYESSSSSSSDDTDEETSAVLPSLSAADILDGGFLADWNCREAIYLSEHIRCASHTLNLLAKSDFKKAIESQPHFKANFDVVMEKIKTLWTRISKSTLASDQVNTSLGITVSDSLCLRYENCLFGIYFT